MISSRKWRPRNSSGRCPFIRFTVPDGCQHHVCDTAIKEEVAKRAGRQHITVVTTLGGQLWDFESEPAAASYRQALLDVYRHNFAILAKYGVRIAIGSDQYFQSQGRISG
jgi:hypothetical protein